MPSNRPVPVLLTFDVEDPFTPDSDDALVALAIQLRMQGAPATFCLTGDKTRALRDRGRHDVPAALRYHDIGYHTDRHSVHPTVAEYLEHTGWSDGVEQLVSRERGGADLLRDTLDRDVLTFASPGTSWGPQIAGALPQLGIASHIHSFSRTGASHNPHWYAGSLCFARNEAIGPIEDKLLDDNTFRDLLADLPRLITHAANAASPLLHLYIGHPTAFVTSQFWDALNYADGTNPPPGAAPILPQRRPSADTIAMFARLRHLVDVLNDDDRVAITPLHQILAHARTTRALPETWLHSEISCAAATADIRTTSTTASPAQLLHALCSAAAGAPSPMPRPELHGPVTSPRDQRDTATTATDTQLVALVNQLLAHTARTATLPAATAAAGGVTITLGTLYRTLINLADAGHLNPLPPHITLTPGPETPSVAADITDHYRRRIPRWLHKPDLDVTTLCHLTEAQTWSLRGTAAPGT